MTRRVPTFRGLLPLKALALVAAGAAATLGRAADPAVGPNPAAIAQELRSFQELGSVLYVAAHPDDENTQLITYFARGRDYRTAYLSLTRGDGGQNLLGPEFGDLLGVIRTQELLAARGLDGGQQFFSRARDFGYSKDYRQTLTKWDHQGVLADVVRVIRTFRPDIIVTRFPPEPSGTHGHHTASSALALEAFKLAGDPTAFPDQLTTLAPWQAKRILWNRYGPGFGVSDDGVKGVIKIPIDGTDAVTGTPFAVLAAKSRSMHRTQGFANFSVASGGTGPRIESFQVRDGAPADKDVMDGVDTTWGRIPGGDAIVPLAQSVASAFNPADPSASVPALLDIKARLSRLGPDPLVDDKRRQLDKIIADCLGLSVKSLVDAPEIVPSEKVTLHESALVQSGYPVTWAGVRYPMAGTSLRTGIPMTQGVAASRDTAWEMPPDTPLSQPYWLREDGTPGMFRVDDASLIGRPENPPVIPVEDSFVVDGQTIVVRHEAKYVAVDPAKGEVLRRPEIVAPVSISFGVPVQLFMQGSRHALAVDITAARANQAGTLSLTVPEGWSVVPQEQAFHLLAAGDTAHFSFVATAPLAPSTGQIAAHVSIRGAVYDTGRIAINYPHIPPLLLQPRARMKVVSLELEIRGRNVGYLPGAGDSTAAGLEQMGYTVTTLTGADMTASRLASFDAVVIGVRAFNTRKDLPAQLPALFGYVESGGTVVEQYNTPGGLQTPELAPYTLKLARDLPHYRVTDEKSAVTLLEPGNAAFNVPNRITAEDFEGWVQERGLDFASEWDTAHFVPLLSCSDVGEAPLKGGLLVAHFGRGYFVYTGLSFFRQLPAGVPGAYRLFANLVSLGK